ncbi:MAG: DNA repair protein RecN, partial [Anaerolineae bacterium]|nr:DNA repair protein RecN [Anaerolineae bacterium]
TFQVDEISAAALEPGEDEALEGERRRLSNAEQLTRLAENARSYLDQGSDEQAGAMDLLSDVAGKLARLVAIDPDASDMLDVAEALNDQLSDLARSLEAYVEGIEFNPERLAEVEERLNLIFNLRRKYGDTLPDIISFGERALAELDRLTNAEVRTGELETEEARLLETIGAQGAALSIARRAAAIRMAAEVERELADLRMERARFDVDFRWKEVDDGAV